MSVLFRNAPLPPRQPVPRGLARSGPAILSYGFRPFFLLAGVFAVFSMGLWVAALSGGVELAGDYGMLNWHAHEMLFGYGTAALAGFMLTAIPNWTGRLPVSGRPLLGLVLVWVLGRAALLATPLIGVPAAAATDALFLPLLAFIAGREIIAGKNWKNLKVLAALTALTAVNIGFHLAVAFEGDMLLPSRAGTAVYVLLVALIGGRIVPSFTRNWLSRMGETNLPGPFGLPDRLALGSLAMALVCWVMFPDLAVTSALAVIAAGLNLYRLYRWRGWATVREPLVLVLHAGYIFIPLGLITLAAAALGLVAPASALHVLTVGVIGGMTLAVMTRASRGHTGNPLAASRPTSFAYVAIFAAALLRPVAEALPDAYHLLLGLAGAAWMLGFLVFVTEYAPMLLTRQPQPAPRQKA